MIELGNFFPRAPTSIDSAFARWAGVVAAHPWPVVVVCLLALVTVATRHRTQRA